MSLAENGKCQTFDAEESDLHSHTPLLESAIRHVIWKLASQPVLDGGLLKRHHTASRSGLLGTLLRGNAAEENEYHSATGEDIVDYLDSCCCLHSIPNFERRQMVTRLARYLQVERLLYEPVASKKQHTHTDVTLIRDDRTQMIRFLAKKRIVVLGGGIGGTALLRSLESKFGNVNHYEIFLVDRKPKFECIPSFPVLFSNPDHVYRISSKYSNFLHKTTVIMDTILEMRQQSVILEQYGQLDFDYCIIATGSSRESSYSVSTTLDNIVDSYNSADIIRHFPDFEHARSIAVLGGGFVALEVIFELLNRFSRDRNKTITAIMRSEHTLERLHSDADYNIMKRLSKHPNVKVLTGANIESVVDDKVYFCRMHHNTATGETSLGRSILEIQADVIVLASGFGPNTSFMQRHFSSIIRDRFVDVNKYFMVRKPVPTEKGEYFCHIFAIGDIANIAEEKLAQNAEQHASVVANNLVRIEKAQIDASNTMLTPYKPSHRFLIISLGPKNALLVRNNKVWINSFVMTHVKNIVEAKMMFTRV